MTLTAFLNFSNSSLMASSKKLLCSLGICFCKVEMEFYNLSIFKNQITPKTLPLIRSALSIKCRDFSTAYGTTYILIHFLPLPTEKFYHFNNSIFISSNFVIFFYVTQKPNHFDTTAFCFARQRQKALLIRSVFPCSHCAANIALKHGFIIFKLFPFLFGLSSHVS